MGNALTSPAIGLDMATMLVSNTVAYNQEQYDDAEYLAALTTDSAAIIATAAISGAIAGGVAGAAMSLGVGAIPGAVIGAVAGIGFAVIGTTVYYNTPVRNAAIDNVSNVYRPTIDAANQRVPTVPGADFDTSGCISIGCF